MNSSFSLNLSHNSLISVNDSNILSNNFSLASRFTDTVTWSLGAVGNYASRAVNEVFDALMLSEDGAGSPAGSQDRSVHRSLTSTRETTARGSRSGRNGRAPESGNTVTTRSTSTTVSRTSPSRPPSSATSRDKVKEKASPPFFIESFSPISKVWQTFQSSPEQYGLYVHSRYTPCDPG